MLQMVLLADAAEKTPETLSHGMLKRIAIAQAFLGAPELVLLDEPTAGLDPATASAMKNLIRSLDKERTFIVSSHNLQDIEELCGSVVILDRGKIVEHRKVSELVGRTSCLTFRLEADPPAAIVAKLSAVRAGDARRGRAARASAGWRCTSARRGKAARNKMQIAVLQALSAAGVGDDRDDARAVAAGQGHRDDAPGGELAAS